MRFSHRLMVRLVCVLAVAGASSCLHDQPEAESDAGLAEHRAALTAVPSCYGSAGLQPQAPSPMVGLCPTHRNQSPAVGAQSAVKPTGWTNGIAQQGVVRGAPVIASNGVVIVGSTTRVTAWTASGGTRWYLTPGNGPGASVAIGADGTVYQPTSETSSKLRALNLADGSSRWVVIVGGTVSSGPVLSSDGATVYVASQSGRFVAYNTANGAQRWSITKGAIWNSPAIDGDGILYVAADDGLHAIRPADGSTVWTRPLGAQVRSSPAIAKDGTIYVGTELGKLEATNPDGSVRWTFTMAGMGAIRSSPAIARDGTIYFGSRDKKLYALNPDGTLKWSFLTGGNVDSSPAIGGDGTIYVGSDDFKLYAIRPDGTQLFNVATGNFVRGGVSIGRNGTVYVGSDDQKLWAFGPGPCGSTDTTCDGRDDNCNGSVDESYVSQPSACGVGACARTGSTVCSYGVVQSGCVAGTPAADDATCNNIDEDCSGSADEDYASLVTSCGVGGCARSGVTSCVSGAVRDSCAPGIPAASDTTCNGIDDDCNGVQDEGYASTATSCGLGPCARSGNSACVSGSVQSNCTPGTPPSSSDSSCNGIDDDCNGTLDDGCTTSGLPWREDFETPPPSNLPVIDLSSRFQAVNGNVLRGVRVTRGSYAAEFGNQLYWRTPATVQGEVVKLLNTSGYNNVVLRFWRQLALQQTGVWTVRYSTTSATGPWTNLESLHAQDGKWQEISLPLPSAATLWLSFGVDLGEAFEDSWAFLDEIRVTGDRNCGSATDCNDGFACSSDQCSGGTCTHAAQASGTACADRSLLAGGAGSGVCDGTHCVECVGDSNCSDRDGVSCTTPKCRNQRCFEDTTAACNLSWGDSCSIKTAKFVPADLQSDVQVWNGGAGFGVLAASNDRVVVGAMMNGAPGTADGAAFVYRFDGTSWLEEAKLTASDPLPETTTTSWPGGAFGSNVAIDGNTIAVTAWARDDRAASKRDAGSVYIYENTSGAWQLSAQLFSPEPCNDCSFGDALALSGDWLAVAGYDADGFAAPLHLPGAVYMYQREGTAWAYKQKLQPADLSIFGILGWGLALSGDRLLLSGEAQASDAIRPTLYAFRHNGSQWVQTQELRPADSQADSLPANYDDGLGMQFGDGYAQSIAIDGVFAFVGAWGHDDEQSSEGAAYVYRYSEGAWQEVQRLSPPEPEWGSQFGFSVALKGTLAVVTSGRQNYYVNSPPNVLMDGPGKAYIYQYDATHNRWIFARAVSASDANSAQTRFGTSAAIAQGAVLIGAPAAPATNFSGTPGAMYAFTCGGTLCANGANANGCNPSHLLTGPMLEKWNELGGQTGSLGALLADELAVSAGSGGGLSASFENGCMFWSEATGTHVLRPEICAEYAVMGGPAGFMGFPTTDSDPTADGVGARTLFQEGAIFWSPATGAHSVHGAIWARYDQLGREASGLGYPADDEGPAADGVSRLSLFQHGVIYWVAGTGTTAGPHVVQLDIFYKWASLGGELGSFGYPTTDTIALPDGTSYSVFEGGLIFLSEAGAHAVFGAILDKWVQLGFATSQLGYPITDEVPMSDGLGRVQYFVGGNITWSPTTGAHPVSGTYMSIYQNLAGPIGRLGYPLTDHIDEPFQRFQFGGIYTSASGSFAVYDATDHGFSNYYAEYVALGDHDRSLLGLPTTEFNVLTGRQDFEHGVMAWNTELNDLIVYYDDQPVKGATDCADADNCNPCVNNVQAQFQQLTAQYDLDSWQPRSYPRYTIWQVYPPSSLSAASSFIGSGAIQDSHIGGFVRTAAGQYAFAFGGADTIGTLSFVNSSHDGLSAIHQTEEHHPGGLFAIGHWVGLVVNRTRLAFVLATNPTGDLVVPRGLPPGHEDAQPGQGASMARLRSGEFLIMVTGTRDSANGTLQYWSTWSLLRGANQFAAPIDAQGHDRFLGQGPEPGLADGVINSDDAYQNSALITECGTGDLYAIHAGGDGGLGDVIFLGSGDARWHLAPVYIAGRTPYLKHNLGAWHLGVTDQDINFCWPRGGASAVGDLNGKLHLVCGSRSSSYTDALSQDELQFGFADKSLP